ncbi:barstar family protein [Streptomyces sp. RerS4]|uniref:barstar family protein n=1 Tax=Streptomyces sp. RerS4 TaxID=2942449 RepID=UPI00201C90D6|nr:barstar family protein [Streptomyces sp. RerS4]UQX01585.1 barstar family protein [Streptomyces sp. RerS4]
MTPWKARWSRPPATPPRYVVTAEAPAAPGEDPDGRLIGVPYAYGYEVLAQCAAVEGLFAEPPAPPREELVLFGCAPEGVLRDAVDGKDGGRAGHVRLDVSLGGERIRDWSYLLHDLVVTDRQPSPEDPGLVDVAVEAGVEAPDWSFGSPSASRQEQMTYTLYDESSYDESSGEVVPYGTCAAVPGLFAGPVDRSGIRERPDVLRLLGCEPGTLSRRTGWGRAELLAIDRTGRVMTGRDLSVHVTDERPSTLGDGLLDVTLTGRIKDRPLPAARPLWQAWERGRPTAPGLWARFPDELHGEWLDLAVPHVGEDRQGGAYHLDGRSVTGWRALHCALGEAVNGPGGYYGRCWNSLFDALSGGFGATPPFTLVWHDYEATRRALADGSDASDASYADEVLGRLRAFGVRVEVR